LRLAAQLEEATDNSVAFFISGDLFLAGWPIPALQGPIKYNEEHP
jgi:hypothetical protein